MLYAKLSVNTLLSKFAVLCENTIIPLTGAARARGAHSKLDRLQRTKTSTGEFSMTRKPVKIPIYGTVFMYDAHRTHR